MNSIEKTLIDSIVSFHKRLQIPLQNSSFLIAYSGGADSTALLHLYQTLCRSNSFRLAACYVNHHLRPEWELEEELELIRKKLSGLNLPLFIEDIDLNGADYKKQSPEEAARNGRLKALDAVREKNGFDYIVVAHHLEDQMETIVQRLFQNGTVAGLSGIPEKRGRIIRPLLSVEKREILAYLESDKLSFSRDSTNSQNIYLRNRIRSTVVPALDAVFPQFRQALEKLAHEVGEIKINAFEATERIQTDNYDNLMIVDVQSFFSAKPYIRKTFLLNAFNRLNKGLRKEGYRLPERFLQDICSADSSSPSLNTSGHGLTCLFSKERIFLFNERFPVAPEPFSCTFRESLDFAYSGIKIHLGINCLQDSVRTLKLPICSSHNFVFRSILPGDTILTDSGTKKVNRFLQEKRIPAFFRKFYAVLEYKGNIAALLPCLSFFPIFDESSIKIQFKGDFSLYFYYISY